MGAPTLRPQAGAGGLAAAAPTPGPSARQSGILRPDGRDKTAVHLPRMEITAGTDVSCLGPCQLSFGGTWLFQVLPITPHLLGTCKWVPAWLGAGKNQDGCHLYSELPSPRPGSLSQHRAAPRLSGQNWSPGGLAALHVGAALHSAPGCAPSTQPLGVCRRRQHPPGHLQVGDCHPPEGDPSEGLVALSSRFAVW